MKLIWTKDLPIDDVIVPARLRPISDAHVEVLAASMAETGLQQPITVGLVVGRTILIAGAHRLAAAKLLGWDGIECRIMEPETDNPEAECRLTEIDENLVRHELNPLDRAVFLAERKRVHEALYPETKRGGDRRSKAAADQMANIAVWSFSKDTAKRTGLSDRLIRRATQVHDALAPDVREALRGTKLTAKEGELFRLSRHGHERQRDIVAMIKAGTASNVEAAVRFLDGALPPDPTERAYQKLLAAWLGATSEAREQFIAHLRGTGSVR